MKTFEVVLDDGTVVFSKLKSLYYPKGEVRYATVQSLTFITIVCAAA